MQFGAALYRPNQHGPAAGQLHQTVQDLRDALCSPNSDIISLKEQNKALTEQVKLVENGWRQKESQLKEALRQNNELLKKVVRKFRLTPKPT